MPQGTHPIRVMVIFGTRPEAIKMAPIVSELASRTDDFQTQVCVTAQHRSMLDQVLQVFGIRADHDLNIMEEGQTLTDITSRVLYGLQLLLAEERPSLILVQGDTTTVFAASLAAFYQGETKVAVGHVEAGLRTDNKFNPYPEEINRRLTTALADIHFAPTLGAKKNLLREGVPESAIYVTGNSVIDALLQTSARTAKKESEPGRRMVLVTAHRRENLGEPMRRICEAVRDIARQFPDVVVVFPMHKNPKVRETVLAVLQGEERVHLTEPPDYLEFVECMEQAHLILTDSGGVQEEAPSLGKPVLVLRETTERPEAIQACTALLVGTDPQTIVKEASRLLSDDAAYDRMSHAANPYGDGKAARRTAEAILHHFGRVSEKPEDFAWELCLDG